MLSFFRTLFVLTILASPFSFGCSSQQSVDDTPIQATDEGDTEAPANDADSP
ncbi:MAG: hypothetical protein JXM70_04360 [Pirellulales bacterium]|nr:hypothetical protein [Pirellulales bacterium]